MQRFFGDKDREKLEKERNALNTELQTLYQNATSKHQNILSDGDKLMDILEVEVRQHATANGWSKDASDLLNDIIQFKKGNMHRPSLNLGSIESAINSMAILSHDADLKNTRAYFKKVSDEAKANRIEIIKTLAALQAEEAELVIRCHKLINPRQEITAPNGFVVYNKLHGLDLNDRSTLRKETRDRGPTISEDYELPKFDI